jgi:hypothetical protein
MIRENNIKEIKKIEESYKEQALTIVDGRIR